MEDALEDRELELAIDERRAEGGAVVSVLAAGIITWLRRLVLGRRWRPTRWRTVARGRRAGQTGARRGQAVGVTGTDAPGDRSDEPPARPKRPPGPTSRPARRHADGAAGGAKKRAGGAAVVLALVLGGVGVHPVPGPRQRHGVLLQRRRGRATAATAAGDQRFRLQGTVDNGSIQRTTAATSDFTVTYNGATVPVTYHGRARAASSKAGIPVVRRGPLGRRPTALRRRPHPGEAHRAVHREAPGPGHHGAPARP